MANPIDKVHQNAVMMLAVERQRMAQYKTQYTEQDAQRLADAYMKYSWVNPEILISTVLAGQDDLLPKIAEYASVQGAKSGWSVVEQSKRDNQHNDLTGRALTNLDDDTLLRGMIGNG